MRLGKVEQPAGRSRARSGWRHVACHPIGCRQPAVARSPMLAPARSGRVESPDGSGRLPGPGSAAAHRVGSAIRSRHPVGSVTRPANVNAEAARNALDRGGRGAAIGQGHFCSYAPNGTPGRCIIGLRRRLDRQPMVRPAVGCRSIKDLRADDKASPRKLKQSQSSTPPKSGRLAILDTRIILCGWTMANPVLVRPTGSFDEWAAPMGLS